jgi:phospholipid transport system substrate-binding protein
MVSKAKKNHVYSSEPGKFITEIVSELSKVLAATNSEESKKEKLQEIALATVDIEAVVKHSLGKYFKELNDNELAQYQSLFKKCFIKSLTSRLINVSETNFNLVSSEKHNESISFVQTLHQSTNEEPGTKIKWRVYTKNPDKHLIRDVIIEGISIARTQRQEFASIIHSNDDDVKSLFQYLNECINK